MTPSHKFCVHCYFPILDQIVQSLDHRIAANQVVSDRFGFLHRLQHLVYDEIIDAASKLIQLYNDDLYDTIVNELVQFKNLLQSVLSESDSILLRPNPNAKTTSVSQEQHMYQFIYDKHLQAAFPNTEILLRMYLVIMTSNCSGERSFSKLKLIKSRFRTTMSQDRLCSLSLLSIEHDILREMDFSTVIDDFAKR